MLFEKPKRGCSQYETRSPVEHCRHTTGKNAFAKGQDCITVFGLSAQPKRSVGSVRIGEVLEEVARGVGPGWSGYPVLGATREGLTPAKEPVGKAPERYKLVSPGTVFYNPMRIMIGSIAMVDVGDVTGITSPDYVVLKGREGRVHSRWFYYWLRSSYGKRCIESLARGAVRERMLFNRLADGEMVLPPYSEQEAAGDVLGPVRDIRAASALRLKEIAMLPARMLRLAFENS